MKPFITRWAEVNVDDYIELLSKYVQLKGEFNIAPMYATKLREYSRTTCNLL